MSCGRRPRVGGGVGAACGRGQEEIPCWPCAMIVTSGSHICGVHPSLFSFLFYFNFLGDRRSSSWHSAVLYNDNPGHSPARHASLASEKLFLCHSLLVTPCTGTAQPTCMVQHGMASLSTRVCTSGLSFEDLQTPHAQHHECHTSSGWLACSSTMQLFTLGCKQWCTFSVGACARAGHLQRCSMSWMGFFPQAVGNVYLIV